MATVNYIPDQSNGIYINKLARIGGIFYLLIIIAGICSELLARKGIIVHGDAAATATRLAASQSLWRIGIASDILMHIFDIPLMVILYILLRPVNKDLALMEVFFKLAQSAILVATKLNLFTPLYLTGDAHYLQAFTLEQRQALSYLSILSDEQGFSVGLIFFGFGSLLLGYLVYKSGYLPRFIGILMAIAGACYLVNSFTLILAPDLASRLFPAILLPSFIAELILCFRLLLKGVNIQKWQQIHAKSNLSSVPDK
jgi:hypothetical protein